MPAGRPKGGKNQRNLLTDALKERIPTSKLRRRIERKPEAAIRYISSLPVDAVTHALLTIHAQRRGVHKSWLINDILNLWCAAATDYEQAIFKEMLPPNARAARVPERYPGYIAGLGFAPETQSPLQASPSAQPYPYSPRVTSYPIAEAPTPPAPQVPSQTSPDVRTLGDLTQPYRHPSTQGPASYPHPAPSLPTNAQLFDPSQHRQTQAPLGTGNAAQRVSDGNPIPVEQPQLTPEVEAYLAYYRVKPEDIR